MKRRDEIPKTIKPVLPNIGIEAEYRKRLRALITEMHDDVLAELKTVYEDHPPAIAADASPADVLQRAIKRLTKRWQTGFDQGAEKLAAYFAKSVKDRSERQLKKLLRDIGFSVKFQMSAPMRDILDATINAQVGLIKSIPQQYLGQVEGAVMRSVQTGRDLHTLSQDIQAIYGVTKKRAALIARDQNNKATASMTRARQTDLGITEAIWVHSTAGKEPRPTHLAAGKRKQRYDVEKGWYDPHEKKFIFPGELINCRCVSRSIIPGFS